MANGRGTASETTPAKTRALEPVLLVAGALVWSALASSALGACGDGDDPPVQFAPITGFDAGPADGSGPRDAGAPVLASLGALTIASPPSVAVLAAHDVALDATVSGGAGPYRIGWKVLSGPTVALTGGDTLNPSFHASPVTAPTVLTLEASVVDATGASATTTVAVQIAASDLALVVTGDQVALSGAEVRLHALATGNLDGLIYAWAQTSGTPALPIQGPGTRNASIVLPVVPSETAFVFQAVATNAAGRVSVGSPMKILAEPVAGAPSGGALSVSAGLDGVVADRDHVLLYGIATGGSGMRTWGWTQISGTPAVTISGADTPIASMVMPHVTADEAFGFQLSVTDSAAGLATDSVLVTVRADPALVANAGADQIVSAGAEVFLGGGGAGGAGPYTYAWKAAGAARALAIDGSSTMNAHVRVPAVVADETITLELTITDANGLTATDDVAVVVKAPHAVAIEPNGPEDAGAAYRPLTDAERTVFNCDGDACTNSAGGGGTQVLCDDRAPFAMTTLAFDGAGGVSFSKQCVDGATCLAQWWVATAQLDQCVGLLPPTNAPISALQFGGVTSRCSYCCFGQACNAGIVPALATPANCDHDVCYPPAGP